jgi:hypothetical protein
VHVVKNFFMITQLFGGNSVQFIMKNTQRWTSLKLSKSSRIIQE